MNILGLGIGPTATLAGFLLVGLAASPETGSPPEDDCTELIAHDFTTATGPVYPNYNAFWRNPGWIPDSGYDPPLAEFPDLLTARQVQIAGGELTYGTFHTFALISFGAYFGGPYYLVQIPLDHTRTAYAECGANFHVDLYDSGSVPEAFILQTYDASLFGNSFVLEAIDADGPPAGDIEIRLRYVTRSGLYESVTAATKPRSFADGLHTFRVEMTPSTAVVPGSTTNLNLNFDGVARVYIDGVLEYENLAVRYRPRHAFTANIDDCFNIGEAVGLGHDPFLGGFTYVTFGYCDTVEPEPPIEPPNPGGELPEPTEPLESDLPLGVSRIFALLTYGEGSPYSTVAVAETDLNDPDSWYGGYKAPWLLGVSTIERELSDSLRGVEVTVTVADPERVFRALATTDTLSGSIMEIFLVSDTVRYALGEPFRRFAGRVHDHRALSGFRYEFVLRDVLSDELGRLADAPRIPPDRLTATKFPGMTADYENRAVPIALGEVSDETEITPQGVVPPMIVAPSMSLSFFGGVDVQVVGAILSHGAVPAYGFLQGYYNTVSNPYVRIPIPDSAWGTILTAPGQPGWNYVGVDPDLFVDYPSDPTLTHRYTPVFFLASDPNVQAVLDGRVQVAFNIYGLTENADGTGRYFSDAPDIYEFLIRNWLYPPHWRYGEYNGTPVLPRGYTIVNHDSVVLSRTRLRDFLGSPANYPVGFLLGGGGEQQTLRHVLTELCHGVLMEQGIDRHGRILLDVEDVDAVATLNLSDLLDIETGEFEVWVDRASYRDTAEYVFGPRYLPAVAPLPTPPEGETLPPVNVGPHENWSAVATFTHTDAVTANQNLPAPPLVLENYVVRNSDVAANWAERTINRLVGPAPSYDGQRLFRLTTSWQALQVELGDVIAIDHIEGLGPSGYIGQRARVLKIIDDLQNNRIVLEGRVLFGDGSPS